MASISLIFKWSSCPVFKQHLNTRPFRIQPIFDFSNTELVWYSDPHCNVQYKNWKYTQNVGCHFHLKNAPTTSSDGSTFFRCLVVFCRLSISRLAFSCRPSTQNARRNDCSKNYLKILTDISITEIWELVVCFNKIEIMQSQFLIEKNPAKKNLSKSEFGESQPCSSVVMKTWRKRTPCFLTNISEYLE